jgi:AcrR family transcriptional regulator
VSTSPGLRERKKARTRATIQREALRLFQRDGYHATSVEAIAAAAEVSPSTFFRYFKTKEDVVLEDEYDPMLAAIIVGAPAELSPLAAIRYAVVTGLGRLPVEEYANLLTRVRLIAAVPALRTRMYDNINAQVDIMAVPLAGRLGVSPDDFGVRVLCGAVVGAMLPAIFEWAGQDGQEPITAAIVRAMDILIDGLAAAREQPVPGRGAPPDPARGAPAGGRPAAAR